MSITCPSSANWSLRQNRARSRRSALTLASPTSPRSRPERRSSTPASCKGPSGGSGACTGSCRGTGRGSSNREKARLLLARQYERLARKRADFLHRLTSEYGLIRFEDLNVAGMLKNHLLARGIADSGRSMFAQMCEYKAAQRGVRVFYVDRFYPSSKACHVCGLVNEDLKLSDRTWTCSGCGTKHDRDENAAINLLNAPTVGATGRKRLGRQRKTRDKRAAVVEPGSQGASSPW